MESKLESVLECGGVQCEAKDGGIPRSGKLEKGSKDSSSIKSPAFLLQLSHAGLKTSPMKYSGT